MSRPRRSPEEALQKAYKDNSNYTYSNIYWNEHDSHYHLAAKCKYCGYERDVMLSKLKSQRCKTGCPACNGYLKMTPEQVLQKAKEYQPDLIFTNPYIVPHGWRVTAYCPIHDRTWETQLHDLKQSGCRLCGIEKQNITPEEALQRAQKNNNNFTYSNPHRLLDWENKAWAVTATCKKCGSIKSSIALGHLKEFECPICQAASGTSWQDRELYQILLQYDPKAQYRTKDVIGLELDIYCPILNTAFEIGSWYWHYIYTDNKWSHYDFAKRKLCKEKNIKLINIYDAVPEDISPPFSENCYLYPKDFGKNKEEFLPYINDILRKEGIIRNDC